MELCFTLLGWAILIIMVYYSCEIVLLYLLYTNTAYTT